jgi:hypothetical protein
MRVRTRPTLFAGRRKVLRSLRAGAALDELAGRGRAQCRTLGSGEHRLLGEGRQPAAVRGAGAGALRARASPGPRASARTSARRIDLPTSTPSSPETTAQETRPTTTHMTHTFPPQAAESPHGTAPSHITRVVDVRHQVLNGVQQDDDERGTDMEAATALLPEGPWQSFQETHVTIAPSAQPRWGRACGEPPSARALPWNLEHSPIAAARAGARVAVSAPLPQAQRSTTTGP